LASDGPTRSSVHRAPEVRDVHIPPIGLAGTLRIPLSVSIRTFGVTRERRVLAKLRDPSRARKLATFAES
jgi:hypothetical protein